MHTQWLPITAFACLTLAAACSDDPGADQPSTSSAATSGGSKGSTSSGQNPMGVELSGDITESMTLTADTTYTLKGVVRVMAGAELTIEAGTTIYGDTATTGTLVIQQGGKINAKGTADAPIVFTSQLPEGQRAAGDWGGVVLLGRAPINEAGGTSAIEGFTTDEIYGGTDAADSSGVLEYVRIEFSGIEISPDNEVNGLTFGGVGSGTVVDHVMVRHTLDDCFEFFGGTVNAKHLVCYRNGDDGFDMDQGYQGKLQFLFLQQDPTLADSTNGIEADNDKDAPDASPVSNPTIYNITLCGQNNDAAKQQYGMLFRRGFNATIGNAIVSGFEAAVDFRDKPYTDVTLSSSIAFGNAPENIAYAEDGTNEDTQADDDAGFDEAGWFTSGSANLTSDPAMIDCFGESPNPAPSSRIAGEAPPDDGFFDSSADYIGAFEDSSDMWMTGAWLDWSQN